MNQIEKRQQIEEKSETLEFVQLESLVNNLDQFITVNVGSGICKDVEPKEQIKNVKSQEASLKASK